MPIIIPSCAGSHEVAITTPSRLCARLLHDPSIDERNHGTPVTTQQPQATLGKRWDPEFHGRLEGHLRTRAGFKRLHP